MNLGLGNLTDLKQSLLPDANQPETHFDTILHEIGSGVAKAFEALTNRRFARVEGETYEVSADRSYCVVPRFPIEVITAVDLRETYSSGWVAQVLDNVIENVSESSGVIEFGTIQGAHKARLRITYTGGWWYDTDEEGGTEQPAGSVRVPEDVRHAWLLQCHHVFEQKDVLGAMTVGEEKMTPTEIKILPQVQEILRPYVRYA